MPGQPSSSLSHRTGWTMPFAHDPIGLNSTINIEFQDALTSDYDLVRAHYRDRKQHKGFYIPDTIWQNHPDVFDMLPPSDLGDLILYKYALPPSRDLTPSGRVTIRVSIRSFF